MKIANRKAKSTLESHFSALEAFANLGERPENWNRFRLMFPDFFPENLTQWFYEFANEWARKFEPYTKVKAFMNPPLLFYRDLLRAVWSRKDHDGVNLKMLLGFEKSAGRAPVVDRPVMPGAFIFKKRGKPDIGVWIPGQPLERNQQTTIGGLPPGRPIVDGVTGTISWEFGCTLQQSVYELMQQRWRAMVCPECGKFFLADKTRQIYCSSKCFGDMKRKRALDYWNRKGNAAREKRRNKMR